MAHKYEILDIRDRYMIGDWVLNNGNPYRWTELDYNRGVKGMENIKPMPMTKEMLFANGFKGNGCKGVLVHQDHKNIRVFYKIDHFEGSDWFVKEWEVCGICGIEFVHEFQHYLNLVSKYELADNFKIK